MVEAIEPSISVIVGILTIIGFIYAFNKWLSGSRWSQKPSGIFNNNGNIYLVYPNGTTKQVTFVNSDVTPVLGRSKVIFFREEKITRGNQYSRYKLMSLNVQNLREQVVTDQKPFADGLNGSFEILNPGYPSLSTDQTKVVFTIEKYVTASQLVQVDLKTGKWTELFSVENFETIRTGKYKNKLLVGKSEIGNEGRDIYYKVCDHYGKILLEFDGYEEYMKFRSTALTHED